MDWMAAGVARLWLFSSASCLFSQPWALETLPQTGRWLTGTSQSTWRLFSSARPLSRSLPFASLRPRFIQAQMQRYY